MGKTKKKALKSVNDGQRAKTTHDIMYTDQTVVKMGGNRDRIGGEGEGDSSVPKTKQNINVVLKSVHQAAPTTSTRRHAYLLPPLIIHASVTV